MFQRLCVLGAVLTVSAACGAPTLAQSEGQVVGRVGDRAVTMAELDEAWRSNDAASRMRMLQELYETRKRTLDIVIGEILIEQEAIAQGTSRDELLAQELPARTLPITGEDITRVYQQNRRAFPNMTEEQMAPQIRAFLAQQRPMQALHAYMAELRAGADDVRVDLEPPRTAVDVAPGDPVLGPAGAPVEIVEFSDFQCPFCERLTGTLDRLKAEYGDDIRLVFKDFPLPNHAQAFKAAEAGLCANMQGKFWELHDTLFGNQEELQVDDLKRHAGELEMDQAAFDACLDSGRFAEQVNADLALGQALGVQSTPTVFINGRAVMGAAPYEVFEEIVRDELDRAQ
jgi:protein-disulfide isomerase